MLIVHVPNVNKAWRYFYLKTETIEYYHDNNIPINWDELSIEQREFLVDRIVENHSYARIESLNKKEILDLTTANAIKTVKDALENKAKLLTGSLYRTIAVTWKCIK